MGRPAEGEIHCREGVALYDPVLHRASAFQYGGHDPGVCARSFGTLGAWELGYPDQALQRARDGLALASQLAQPVTSVLAFFTAGILLYHRGETRSAIESAERVVALGRAHGIALWTDFGSVLLGRLLLQAGDREEGFRHLLGAREGATGIRWTWGAAFSASLLAAAHLEAGQLERAREILDALAARGGEGFYEPEIQRMRGELLVAERPAATDEAAACFRRGIEVARKWQAKSLELRATMSLIRLLSRQGKRDEARQMLADAYSWFTEGFETADLKSARALLQELWSGPAESRVAVTRSRRRRPLSKGKGCEITGVSLQPEDDGGERRGAARRAWTGHLVSLTPREPGS
jgi:predicted ATPase